MRTLTLRDIPESVAVKVSLIAKAERRSINQQFIVIIEEGLAAAETRRQKERHPVSKDVQLEMWETLLGTWEDSRSTKAIIEDITSNRSKGREFKL